ncbi:hypothetical protein ACFLZK_00540 [Patescibacteria group bacterium]
MVINVDSSEIFLTVCIIVFKIVTWFYIITILPVIFNLVLKRIKNKEAFKLKKSIKTYFILGIILTVLFAPLISANATRSYRNVRVNLLERSVETGIYGRITYKTGNCMPGPAPTLTEVIKGMYTKNIHSCRNAYSETTIFINKLESENSEEITDTLQIKTDKMGYFSVELAPGHYNIYSSLTGASRTESYNIQKGIATRYSPWIDKSVQ